MVCSTVTRRRRVCTAPWREWPVFCCAWRRWGGSCSRAARKKHPKIHPPARLRQRPPQHYWPALRPRSSLRVEAPRTPLSLRSVNMKPSRPALTLPQTQLHALLRPPAVPPEPAALRWTHQKTYPAHPPRSEMGTGVSPSSRFSHLSWMNRLSFAFSNGLLTQTLWSHTHVKTSLKMHTKTLFQSNHSKNTALKAISPSSSSLSLTLCNLYRSVFVKHFYVCWRWGNRLI